jgi:hypothetical protein
MIQLSLRPTVIGGEAIKDDYRTIGPGRAWHGPFQREEPARRAM